MEDSTASTKRKEMKKKTVYVIMPFTEVHERNAAELNYFFDYCLKKSLENHVGLHGEYEVRRSEKSFDITSQIASRLLFSDIVLCDLSGVEPNPNVMYELGIRLALSDKPVILIRQEHEKNKRGKIFDIGAYRTYNYTLDHLPSLIDYIVTQIKRFENIDFRSPVREMLNKDADVMKARDKEEVKDLLDGLVMGTNGLLVTLMHFADRFIEKPELKKEFAINGFDSTHEELKGLAWEKFKFQPFAYPALNTFLSRLPLKGFVPKDLCNKFTEAMIEHFSYYFGSNAIWGEPTWEEMKGFVDNSVVIYNSLIWFKEYLESESDEERQKIAHDISRFFPEDESVPVNEVQQEMSAETAHGDGAFSASAESPMLDPEITDGQFSA